MNMAEERDMPPVNEPKRVLFVDDDENILRSIERVLEDADYEVLTASSAREGLRILDEAWPVQVVISDYKMPEMDGMEFLGLVKERWPLTVRMILSLYGDEDIFLSAINMGEVFRFIRKPWDATDLKTSISQAMGKYCLCHENALLAAQLRLKNEDLEKKVFELHMTEGRLRESVSQKELLVKEMNYRIKNNLNMLQGLILLQSDTIKDSETRNILDMSENRFQAVSMLHDMLSKAEDHRKMYLSEYLQALSEKLFVCYSSHNPGVKLITDIEEVSADIDAMVPCGLIVNELVSNAIGHAFPDGMEGELYVGLKKEEGGRYALIVRDNGVGMDEDIEVTDAESLGLSIVGGLSARIGGELELNRQGGTEFRIFLNGRRTEEKRQETDTEVNTEEYLYIDLCYMIEPVCSF
jgi:two-component sensor histidine kinase/CheY-like chemotaxis protein